VLAHFQLVGWAGWRERWHTDLLCPMQDQGTWSAHDITPCA
jgi:hypothetical protein